MSEKQKIKGFALFLVISLFAVSASMCLDTEKESDDEIVFAHQDKVAGAATIIAFEKGFFEEEGLNIRSMQFSSGPACAEALLYGDADFGTMGDTTAITSVSQGHPVTIIASHGSGEDRHRLIVSDKSGITNIEDLEGKSIGIKMGTSTHGGLLLFAERNGLDLDEEMLDLRPSEQLTAFATGEVDAIVASEPTPSIAEYNGYGRELTTLGGLDNTYPITILVNNEFAENSPEKVTAILRVLQKATEFINENPNEAAQIQANIAGVDVEVIENAMELHDYELDMSNRTIESLESTAAFLMDIEKIREVPDFDIVADRSYINELN